MTSIELKEQVVSKIYVTEDMDKLEFVLEFLKQSDRDEPYIFTDVQKSKINISLMQSKNGELITEEDEAKMTNEWFGKLTN